MIKEKKKKKKTKMGEKSGKTFLSFPHIQLFSFISVFLCFQRQPNFIVMLKNTDFTEILIIQIFKNKRKKSNNFNEALLNLAKWKERTLYSYRT